MKAVWNNQGDDTVDAAVGAIAFCISAAIFWTSARRQQRQRDGDGGSDAKQGGDLSSSTSDVIIPRHERFSVRYTDRTKGQVGPRGKAALAPPIPYLESFLTCLNDECHPDTNPKGHVALCVAENKLVLDLIAERFMQAGSTGFADSSVFTYNSMLGMPVAREAAAYFLARRFLWPNDGNDNNNRNNRNAEEKTPEQCLTEIQPKFIGFGAGCAALINHIFFLLGQEGDACLIPKPYYAAFENDMNLIAQITPFGIDQANPPAGPTVDELDAARTKALQKGLNPKFLLLTNPNNPLGTVYAPSVVEAAIDWARLNDMHIVMDEIYALSIFLDDEEEENNGAPSSPRFESVIKILNNQLGTDVHVLWAVSKDFGGSGLRCGLVYSQNEILIEGLATLSIFTCVSGPIQYLVAELLTDDVFVDYFLDESRRRIRASYEITVRKLDEMVIPFVPAKAGMFVYCDFSSLLPERTYEWERELSRLFFEQARVVLTPGESQRDVNPGMFRICYAWVSPAVLEIAMERLSRLVARLRRTHVWDNRNDPRAFAGVLDV